MDGRGKLRRKPSREQARAWLGTVLAPIINGLRVESERVSSGNWSFRCSTSDFEFLWPIEKMLSPVFLPNLRQLWRYHPALKKQAAAHDNALMKLRNACRAAFEGLLRSEDFDRLAQQVPVERGDRKYLAEYIVNGIRDLPSHYAFADEWRSNGGAFLELRSGRILQDSFQMLHQVGEVFRKAVEQLLKETDQLQWKLADELQLPPVDPADVGAV